MSFLLNSLSKNGLGLIHSLKTRAYAKALTSLSISDAYRYFVGQTLSTISQIVGYAQNI